MPVSCTLVYINWQPDAIDLYRGADRLMHHGEIWHSDGTPTLTLLVCSVQRSLPAWYPISCSLINWYAAVMHVVMWGIRMNNRHCLCRSTLSIQGPPVSRVNCIIFKESEVSGWNDSRHRKTVRYTVVIVCRARGYRMYLGVYRELFDMFRFLSITILDTGYVRYLRVSILPC